jgi:hypothetical protein
VEIVYFFIHNSSFQIYGDVKIASGDIIRIHQPRALAMPYVVRLERELVPNCVIKIHGKPNISEGGFSIGLYHNGLEHNPAHQQR